jgi:hypothetical protein
MSAPVASETRRPFRASREISACSAAEPGSYQQGAELVAVQRDRVRLIIQPRPPHMGRRGVIQEFFLDRVLVEPRDSAQPPGNGRPRPPSCFQVPGKAFDAGPADREQVQGAGTAPAGELAQVQGIRVTGQAAVACQEPGEREPLGVGENGWIVASAVDGAAVVIGHLPAGLEPGAWARPGPSDSTETHRKPHRPVTPRHN